MALKDNASLALIPAAYKTSKIYSAIPTDGDGDFTFTRSGNATRVNKAGLVETMGTNVGRLNYDLTNGTPASCPSLLLEPTRLNRVYPNNTLSGYSTLNATVSNNNATSPDGTNNASKITSSFGGSTIGIYRGFSCNGGNYHNFSVFLKKGTYDRIKVQEGFASANMVVNLTTGTEVSSQNVTNKKIEEYPNGWYRVSFDFISNANNNLQYSLYADGTTSTGINFYTFGGQIEQGKGVTSLIPTVGGIVTRNIDYASGAGDANLFNDSEGTLFIEAAALGNDGTYRVINISDGSPSNRVLIQLGNNNNQIRADVVATTTQASLSTTSYNFTEYNKIAIKYKDNDTALFINGTQIGSTQTGITMPTGLDRIDFTNGSLGSSFYFRGKLKQLMYFNTALTNSELQTLTS